MLQLAGFVDWIDRLLTALTELVSVLTDAPLALGGLLAVALVWVALGS